MKRLHSVLFILLSAIILVSCSKEKILSKRLEGMWDIDVYQKIVYGDGTPLPPPESGTAGNAGKFEFFSDGKGQFNVIKDLGQDMYFGEDDFLWTNTSESVSIRTTTGGTKKFEVVTNKKDKMVWERTQIYSYSGGQHGVSYTMEERITLLK
ncbi:MAG: hypothetical protein K9H64_12550 [Bacteroidales bacterium]|nr:hypothetical protein [Bacteroidales bacterium]MCF8456923.1 hypothetical protein [Bacteroidales bacterium]